MSKDETLSKFLSLVLRHDPEFAGIRLDPAGWADIDSLLSGAERAGTQMRREDLERIVKGSDKQRFTISPDGSHIRAAQGHSIEVDLGLTPVTPPEILYHGTAERNVDAILREGLKSQSRQHVHLSSDAQTAINVGSRHGKPLVLIVSALEAQKSGQLFWQAENGVWLTHPLRAEFLRRSE